MAQLRWFLSDRWWFLRDYPHETYLGSAAVLTGVLTILDVVVPWLFTDSQDPVGVTTTVSGFAIFCGSALLVVLVWLKDLRAVAVCSISLSLICLLGIGLSLSLSGPIGPVASACMVAGSLVALWRGWYLLHMSELLDPHDERCWSRVVEDG